MSNPKLFFGNETEKVQNHPSIPFNAHFRLIANKVLPKSTNELKKGKLPERLD